MKIAKRTLKTSTYRRHKTLKTIKHKKLPYRSFTPAKSVRGQQARLASACTTNFPAVHTMAIYTLSQRQRAQKQCPMGNWPISGVLNKLLFVKIM